MAHGEYGEHIQKYIGVCSGAKTIPGFKSCDEKSLKSTVKVTGSQGKDKRIGLMCSHFLLQLKSCRVHFGLIEQRSETFCCRYMIIREN